MSDNEPTPPVSTPPPEPTPTAEPPAEPAAVTDWEAAAKKWEKLAKANKNATEKLAKLEAAAMSEQERAVAEAKAAGASEAAKTYGSKLAAAELKAAAAAKGVDLSTIGKYLKADMFVGDDGEVDEAAIKTAVADFAKLSPRAPGKSGGDFSGAPGGAPASLDAQIAEATKNGDHSTAIRLKRLKAAQP